MLKRISLIITLGLTAPSHALPSWLRPNAANIVDRKALNPKAEELVLAAPENATVADLLTTKKRGHTGFNIPTAPLFTHRAAWQTAPSSMKSFKGHYKLTNGEYLTTAAMYRFRKHSKTLFFDGTKETNVSRTYEAALTNAVEAHKTWFANQTDANLAALNQAEDTVYELLQTLPLSNSLIRTRLEKILSTINPRRTEIFFGAWRSATSSAKSNDDNTCKFTCTPHSLVRHVMGKPLLTGAIAFAVGQAVLYARDKYWEPRIDSLMAGASTLSNEENMQIAASSVLTRKDLFSNPDLGTDLLIGEGDTTENFTAAGLEKALVKHAKKFANLTLARIQTKTTAWKRDSVEFFAYQRISGKATCAWIILLIGHMMSNAVSISSEEYAAPELANGIKVVIELEPTTEPES